MKSSVKTMFKYAFIFGVIFGLLLIIWLTVDYAMGYYGQNKILSNLNYLARIGGIFICILLYRNRINGGYISFGNAFSFGLTTFVIAMVLLEVFVCLLVNIVDPNYLLVKAGLMQKQLGEVGMNNQQVNDILNVAIYMKHPVWAVIIAVIGGSFVGSIVALLSALVLKKEKKTLTYRKRNLRIRN